VVYLVHGQRLEVLEHDAAVTVHDRLRQAGGARGVHHPQRMIERHLFELRLTVILAAAEVFPAHGAVS
jgi:hypothetical protein